MDEERRSTDDVDARLASLAQFGFPYDEMLEFLAEHEGGTNERLTWLEQRRQTASMIDERFQAIELGGVFDEGLRIIHADLNNPFTVEETALDFERHVRSILSWGHR